MPNCECYVSMVPHFANLVTQQLAPSLTLSVWLGLYYTFNLVREAVFLNNALWSRGECCQLRQHCCQSWEWPACPFYRDRICFCQFNINPRKSSCHTDHYFFKYHSLTMHRNISLQSRRSCLQNLFGMIYIQKLRYLQLTHASSHLHIYFRSYPDTVTF